MTARTKYVDLKGQSFRLADFDEEERALVDKFLALAATNPQWHVYGNQWQPEIDRLYSPRGLSRREMIETPVYRILQDLGSRLGLAQGKMRMSDYRDELEQLILTRFKTRRAFCEATGLSEDMLSHVLARRKHLGIDTLTDALAKIGFALHIAPVSEGV